MDRKKTTFTAHALLAQPVREDVVAGAELLMNLSEVVNLQSKSRFKFVSFHCFIDQCTEIIALNVILEDFWKHHGEVELLVLRGAIDDDRDLVFLQ